MTPYDAQRHHRRSIRLPGYDYTQPGAYFVTMVTQERTLLFGDVLDGEMRLNTYGAIADETWRWLAIQYPYVELDAWVIMPNHVHGILMIRTIEGWGDSQPGVDASQPGRDASQPGRGGSRPAPTKPLGQLIGVFKTVSAKRINLARGTPGTPVWQRNYYEHILRDEREMDATRRYILDNPLRWDFDHEYPTG